MLQRYLFQINDESINDSNVASINGSLQLVLPKKAKVPVPHFARPTPTTFGTRWTRGFVLARIVNGQA